jgi:DNA-binding PucR family transcriptional regulator
LAVARIELAAEQDRDLLTRRAMDEELDDLVLDVAGPGWHRARVDGALLLMSVSTDDDGVDDAFAAVVRRVLVAARDAFPQATLFCGVGTRLHGAAGLRESATQAATAAAAARGWGRPGVPVHVDDVGLPPMVVDWLGSRAAQESMARLLSPFGELDAARAETSIRTLQVYLDERGSLTRAGARLHLHKNAVAYRMRRIREQLGDIDLDDPDRRLELQLACRAWLLSRNPDRDLAA